jgi:glycosyltransferase involved in cell wall biosynthesis
LEKVREKFPAAGLMIIGAGDCEDELRRLVAAKSYGKHVCLAGDVAHGVTLHLINDCDVLLRTTRYDGDAISIREALHLDTPVVATDNGMRPEGVHLIPDGDGAALENAIAAALGGGARTKSAKPDDYRNMTAILSLYKEIVGAGATRGEKTLPSNVSSLWLIWIIQHLVEYI